MKKRLIFIPVVFLLLVAVICGGCFGRWGGNDTVSDSQGMVQVTDMPPEVQEEGLKSENVPEVTKEPIDIAEMIEASAVPEVTEEPTEAPGYTEAPAEITEAPGYTEEPAEVTEAPADTEQPVKVTSTPMYTERPVVATAIPVKTQAPVVETAKPTQIPVVATAVPTQAPVTPVPTVQPTPEPTPEHTHIWYNCVVTTEATCGTDGVRTYSCACGETMTESIPKTHAHDYEWGVIYNKPTCATNGLGSGICKVCGYSNVAVIPRTDEHNYVVMKLGCGLAETRYNCSICGDSIWVQENLSCPDSDGDGFCDLRGCYIE